MESRGVKHILIFQNIEGSVVAKASQKKLISDPDTASEVNRSLNSYAAVLANICHEYIEFGTEAFYNNRFNQICI